MDIEYQKSLVAMAKENLRVDYDEDDALISRLVEESMAVVCDMTERSEEELFGMGGGYALPLPLRQAVILLVTHRYDESRGGFIASASRESPFGITRLVSKYRKLVH